MSDRPNFLTSMKKASQRFAATVADTGAKTMLKTDVAFLERDINARKQAFGIEVYGILKANSNPTATGSATISAPDIQKAYEQCQGDIQHLEAKVTSKKREMEAIDQSSNGGVGASSGSVGGGMDDGETPGIPSTP